MSKNILRRKAARDAILFHYGEALNWRGTARALPFDDELITIVRAGGSDLRALVKAYRRMPRIRVAVEEITHVRHSAQHLTGAELDSQVAWLNAR